MIDECSNITIWSIFKNKCRTYIYILNRYDDYKAKQIILYELCLLSALPAYL